MADMNEKMRAEFVHAFIERLGFGPMAASSNPDAAQMFEAAEWAWQASRAALLIELPNRFAEKYQDYYDDVEGGCFNEARYINDLTAVIEAAGVKVKS